jgi:methenyltetrahydromethanopterin cyclohydrolase
MASTAAALRIEISHTGNGTRIIDCGVKVDGGLQAGLALARVCMAAQGEVTILPGDLGGMPCPQLSVTSDNPVIGCMAAQYAGWQISVGKFFGMGSGPMRAAYGKEELFEKVPGKEQAPVAVGVLEADELPGDEVTAYLGEKLGLPPNKITLLVAPTSSLAGTMQVVARSLETALHKLYELKFELTQIVSGMGSAPLPPIAVKKMKAIGRTNDAILYGGRVLLWVRTEDAQITEIGPKVPSSASKDHGEPFAAIFKRYGGDFYKVDPMLFSPAEIVFHNLKTGKTHAFGQVAPQVLLRSFFVD